MGLRVKRYLQVGALRINKLERILHSQNRRRKYCGG
jgi:hypothetical protein